MKLSLRKRTVIWNTFTLVCNTYTLARDTLRQTQLLQANCSDHGETNYSLWLRLKVWCLYKMWISIYRSYHRHWKPWWTQDLNTAGIQYRWHSVPLTFTAPSTHWKDKGFKKKPAIPNMNNTEHEFRVFRKNVWRTYWFVRPRLYFIRSYSPQDWKNIPEKWWKLYLKWTTKGLHFLCWILCYSVIVTSRVRS